MALSEIDRNLLERCLTRQPRSWEDFVDRFMGLVIHVVNHTARARSLRLAPEDREDLCSEVFMAIVANDFSSLRQFRGQCSLATYLTVIARRVIVRELLGKRFARKMPSPAVLTSVITTDNVEQRISDREEVNRALEDLNGVEAEIVRLYHLEGKSYQEISDVVGAPENSIGPTLSRARQKMRRASSDAAT